MGNTRWVKIRCKTFLIPPRHSLCLLWGQYSLWGQQWKGLLTCRGQSICWAVLAGWRHRCSQLSLVTHAASLPGTASTGAPEPSGPWERWPSGGLCCAAHPLMPECRRVKWRLRTSCLYLLCRLSTPLKSSFNQWFWITFSSTTALYK